MSTAADVFKMEIVYTAGGEYMENVIHYVSSLTGSTHPQTNAAALVQAFQSTVQASLLACWQADVTLLGYRANRINNGGGASAVLVAPAGTIGTDSGTSLMATSRTAALLENDYYDAAATPPRWRQGRIFMGGVPGTWFIEGVWVSDARTAYLAFLSALTTTLGSSPNFNVGVWSRLRSTLYVNGSWELSNRIGHQKRRTKPSL